MRSTVATLRAEARFSSVTLREVDHDENAFNVVLCV